MGFVKLSSERGIGSKTAGAVDGTPVHHQSSGLLLFVLRWFLLGDACVCCQNTVSHQMATLSYPSPNIV